ncbi:hypothetical protein [Methylocystis echinoides]|uniref:Uncharacterized protein n=1 Tax=Methylocystis echinoides TaxID=29468 RepID=A0A9W6GUU9_9HYPH|nr:hypothetical protein [Methylocystis echinoides]GLI93304.1 hypothetical protein LMG27198_22960 [Methylocystis echinoides]
MSINNNNVGGLPPTHVQGQAPADQTQAANVPGQGNPAQFAQGVQQNNAVANAFAVALQNVPPPAALPAALPAAAPAAANGGNANNNAGAALPPLLNNPPVVPNGDPAAVNVARRLYYPETS